MRWQRRYAGLLFLTDVTVVCAAVVLAQYLRFGDDPDDYIAKYITAFSVLFAVAWVAALAVFRTRSARVVGAGVEEYRRVASASFATFGAIAIVTLLAKVDIARGYLAVALPAGALGLLAGRLAWRAVMAHERAAGACQTAVLALGDRSAVSLLVNELTRRPRDGYRVVGVGVTGYGAPRGETMTVHDAEVPILGDEPHAIRAIPECGADTVAVTGAERFGVHGIRQLTWRLEAMNVDLVVSPGVMDVADARLAMRPVAGFPLLHVEKPQYHGAQRFQKRAFDFCFALAALLAASPVLLLAALAVKLTSRGPIFYCAERIGRDGQPFRMLKFRSMVADADKQLTNLTKLNESDGGVLFKIRADPRITPVGRVMRRFSIDELPQFINVLKQDMSVVGPRPPLRREVETYNGDVRRRLLVRPGVTGLWQVSGRSDLSWDESVRLDLSYVDNWSMIGDLVIIAKTAKAVLWSAGAY